MPSALETSSFGFKGRTVNACLLFSEFVLGRRPRRKRDPEMSYEGPLPAMTSESPCGKVPEWLTNQTKACLARLVQRGMEREGIFAHKSGLNPNWFPIKYSNNEMAAKFTSFS